jgi:lipoprotein signal peptidase
MRKWLFVMLVLAILYALSKLTVKEQKARYPILKRVDRAISVVVWVLLAAYGVAFIYWLYTQVIR